MLIRFNPKIKNEVKTVRSVITNLKKYFVFFRIKQIMNYFVSFIYMIYYIISSLNVCSDDS